MSADFDENSGSPALILTDCRHTQAVQQSSKLPRAFVDLFRASWVGCTVSRTRKSPTNWHFAFGWAF